MLWRELKAWQVYGANTDVGKTILSTVLSKALARRVPRNGLLYLKPVSTGPDNEADDRHIAKHVPGVISRVVSQFAEPVSPHLAARDFRHRTDIPQSDESILSQVRDILNRHSQSGGRYALLETAGGVLSPGPSGTVQADLYRPIRLPVVLMGDSKLGGIGTTISAFESLHVRGYDVESVLLFDDPKWGNHEYLREHFAKHNIKSFALPLPPPRQEDARDDEAALAEYYDKCSTSKSINSLIALLDRNHFTRISKLTSMPSHAESIIWHPFRQHGLPQNIIAIDSAYDDHFQTYNAESDKKLDIPESGGMTMFSSERSSSPLLTPLFDASASWWTQGLGHGSPTLSLTAAHAAGRYGHVMFASAVHEPALDLSYNLLSTLQNPRLSRVFFTDNGSTGMEVAVKMALRASSIRYNWDKNDGDRPVGVLGLKGSYHGDTIGVMNCSEPNIFNEKTDWYKPWGYWFTPPEIKMKDGKWTLEIPGEFQSQDPSVPDSSTTFPSLSSIFDFTSRESTEAFYKTYITKTLKSLTHDQKHRFGALILEPLIMGAGGMIFVDPLFQRTLVTTIRQDPTLINPAYSPHNTDNADISSYPSPATADRGLDWSGVPIIADEVFTGLFRLGRSSSSSFWNSSSPDASTTNLYSPAIDAEIAPDISAHAKLLTGGLLPLALTTASTSIFNTFLSSSKTDALLHGHSYTAHPIGCSVANKSLEIMNKLSSTPVPTTTTTSSSSSYHQNSDPNPDSTPKELQAATSWTDSKLAWSSTSSTSTSTDHTPEPKIFSFFSPTYLATLSKHTRIESCFTVGTVLVLTVKAQVEADGGGGGGGGYSSNAAAGLQARLLVTSDEDGGGGGGIHSRVLGNVIYFMTSLNTSQDAVRRLERSILRALDEDS